MDNLEDYHEGKGCKCYARSEGECACGVNWTPKQVYVLEAKVKELTEQLKTAKIDAVNEFAFYITAVNSKNRGLISIAEMYCKGLANE